MGIEAAVGPPGELPRGPGVAHPSHRLAQEVSSAPGGVGAALPQPGHQHVSGTGGDGQQRVIAPLAGVAVVAGALLGQAVGLADGGIEVDGQGSVAGSRPSLPGLGQQFPAHPVQLADVAPAEAAPEGSQSLPSRKRGVDGAFTVPPMTRAVPPVRNASASSMPSPPARACPRESGGRRPPGPPFLRAAFGISH